MSSLLSSNPLLLGARGMLHRAWAQWFHRNNLAFVSLGRPEIDLTRPESITRAITDTTRLVINCTAYTNVDAAESDEPAAAAVNGTGAGHLAQRCRDVGALLIHYSTDYVFSGQSTRPYLIDDPIAPLGAYGRSKALGEKLIRESGCDHLIIRTSWLYAPWSKNFVRTIASFVRAKKPLRIVNDQRGRPTSSEHLATATAALLDHDARGTFHVTDGGQCTWFDFACEIRRLIDPSVEVLPCSSAEIARPAPRPAYSVLDLSRTESLIGPMPPWEQNLADVLQRLEP